MKLSGPCELQLSQLKSHLAFWSYGDMAELMGMNLRNLENSANVFGTGWCREVAPIRALLRVRESALLRVRTALGERVRAPSSEDSQSRSSAPV